MMKGQHFTESKHKQITIQRPYVDFPTIQYPSHFFKVRHKDLQGMHRVKIGVKVQQFSKFQQDHVFHFMHQLMNSCDFMKVFVIDPNILYLEMSMCISCLANSYSHQEIALENQIMKVLCLAASLFKQFIETDLSATALLTGSANFTDLMLRFQKKVLHPLNKCYHSQNCQNSFK